MHLVRSEPLVVLEETRDRFIQVFGPRPLGIREEKPTEPPAFQRVETRSPTGLKRVSPNYLRHAAAGIQFGLFVLVGTLIGSYLDRRTSGTGVITFIGLLFGLVSGTYFLIKDFLFKGPGKKD